MKVLSKEYLKQIEAEAVEKLKEVNEGILKCDCSEGIKNELIAGATKEVFNLFKALEGAETLEELLDVIWSYEREIKDYIYPDFKTGWN